MADTPNEPDTGENPGVGAERGSPTRAPRWVPMFGIAVAIALVVLIVALHLTGTIGPGAH